VTRKITTILLDIEGTTTDIEFVHTTLFGVARRELRVYVTEHWDTPEVEAARAAVAREKGLSPTQVTPDRLYTELTTWIDQDRKETSLKALQGKIWQGAYARGELKSHVFDDVPRALTRFHEHGLSIAIFSSGSVEAQRMLFKNTSFGDLSELLSGYFDTTTGAKKESKAYGRIAQQLNVPASSVHFFSDVVGELDAAREAGFLTTHVLRSGAARAPGSTHPTIESFDEVEL
jgi:enolase-phosphatase E1